MKAIIALLPGDGIGPEVVASARAVLDTIAAGFGHELTYREALIGGAAIDATGKALPEATIDVCKMADAVLLGAVGGPKWDDPRAKVRPEQGLLGIRKTLGLYANIRPVSPNARLAQSSPLKPEIVKGVDLVVVRELTGGIYFGKKTHTDHSASDLCEYSDDEIARVARVACTLARGRRRRLTSVDKANVLETSRLWRQVVTRIVEKEFPDIQLEHILVDACAMHLITRPAHFDVIVTENMFGDILTDEASVLSGSIGALPSASLGERINASGHRIGLYEPIHGSAPTIAGQGVANPVGTILSAAMLLRLSLGLEAEAAAIERVVNSVIDAGTMTVDLGGSAKTADVTLAITEALTAKNTAVIDSAAVLKKAKERADEKARGAAEAKPKGRTTEVKARKSKPR